VFLTVARATNPRVTELGRKKGTLGFINRNHEPSAVLLPGLLILRPNEGIFFGNAASLQEEILRRAEEPDAPTEVVLLDLGHTIDLDVPGADMLIELRNDLAAHGIKLYLSGVSSELREGLEKTGVLAKVGKDHVHRLVLRGVEDYLLHEHPRPSDVWEIVHDGIFRLSQIAEDLEPHTRDEERTRIERLREKLASAEREIHPLH
jgi:MFS superfamily sulfate permease-like transporter